jgi:oligoribonuclease NrnB/cAMP/cGMP phosphodiesterase (DHH superfamily)
VLSCNSVKPLCLYHAHCADGFAAAWVVRRRYPGEVEFVPGVHGRPAPDVAGRDVIFVDFAYHRAVTEKLSAAARSLLILDHHKSAAEDLAGMAAASLRIVMDTTRSGVVAAGKPVAAAYFDRADARVFSLRSDRAGIDVAAIAERYGGGGHRHAAGFQVRFGWEGDR